MTLLWVKTVLFLKRMFSLPMLRGTCQKQGPSWTSSFSLNLCPKAQNVNIAFPESVDAKNFCLTLKQSTACLDISVQVPSEDGWEHSLATLRHLPPLFCDQVILIGTMKVRRLPRLAVFETKTSWDSHSNNMERVTPSLSNSP